MKIDVITIFPEYFEPVKLSLLGKAIDKGIVEFQVHNLRDWAKGVHKSVDDTPYGGGAGMIMKADILKKAIDNIIAPDSKLLITAASGKIFNQQVSAKLSKVRHLVLVCGRYEGIDARLVKHYKDKGVDIEEVSIGKFVLFGGEAASLVIVEAVTRLIPGVLGNAESIIEESYTDAETGEYPQFTRPEVFEGLEIPEVLKSGNHAAIAKWRSENRN
jgi:tRNA (guanine37-N1)-methyltransferase